MNHSRISMRTPPRFRFWRTVQSHGWSSLAPFEIDRDTRSLGVALRVANGTVVHCSLRGGPHAIIAALTSKNPLRNDERDEIRRQIAGILRVDDDLSEFYAESRRYRKYRWIATSGAGRLMRAGSVFEDAVKMMCTTNCSWSLTQAMVRNLSLELGDRLNGFAAFPTASAIAQTTELFLRKKIRAGYRSPYLLEFARRVASGALDVEGWRHSNLGTGDLYEQITSVKGMGPYAAGNLLRLLGRYDYLALDSWVRKQYYAKYHGGRKVRDETIERRYEPLGPWRGLFFWLDMTREWLALESPF